jgi:hypothetical protein
MTGPEPRFLVENQNDVWIVVDTIDRKVMETFGRTELQRQRALRLALGRNLEARFAAERARPRGQAPG